MGNGSMAWLFWTPTGKLWRIIALPSKTPTYIHAIYVGRGVVAEVRNPATVGKIDVGPPAIPGSTQMHGHGPICESYSGRALDMLTPTFNFPTSPQLLRPCPPWGRCSVIGTTMIHNDSRRITTTRPCRCAEDDQYRAATSSSGRTSVCCQAVTPQPTNHHPPVCNPRADPQPIESLPVHAP